MRIDLHTHSVYSDGTDSPASVVRQAADAELDVVALTDHDTWDGWDEAHATAEACGIEFVPGIEISCKHHGISIHLLAYWVDVSRGDLDQMLATTRDARGHRARLIVDKLAEDYPITWDLVVERAGGAVTVGRPHIADALVAVGVVPDRTAAFDRILRDGSPYFVPHYAPDVTDALAVVEEAGGVSVFAHPAAASRGRIVDDAVLATMAQAGLAGLEIDHRDHTDAQRDRLERVRQEWDLIRTGASDFHGDGKPNVLGENLTSEQAYRALRARARSLSAGA